jgi:sarcosine oxidase delta subunit
VIDLTLRCPTCGRRADMCFDHGDDWKKRRPAADQRALESREGERRYESWLESLKDHGP